MPSFGQLTVQNDFTGQELAEILAGDNIDVTNASVSGDALQHGSFSFIGDNLEVSSGVILSSGNIFDAVGPNIDDGTTTDFNGPGNSLLTDLANSQTHDATVLQFDFEVQSSEIEFNFIFMSEEYNEFVGSNFNDVFAFFISGPGISGEENLAVIPGTTVPVSINTINNQDFWQFYHDNTSGNTNIEYDGFTTLMKAQKSDLIPCNTYTLKLMIADAGDGLLDAGVLLQENSLVQPNISAASNTYSNNNIALEGCIPADFNFQLDRVVDYDVEIPINFAGTAINGVDYEYIDPLLVIPAGQIQGSVIIESFSDGLAEGQETIELIYSPGVCEQDDTVSLYIDDFVAIDFSADPVGTNCNSSEDGEVLFSITGGFEPYLIKLTDTITGESNTYTENPIQGLDGGIYLVEILDNYGCKAEDLVFGGMFNAGTTFLPTGTGVTYETSIEITGFDEGEILETLDQFEQVSASIEHSYANDLSISLRAPNGVEVLLKAEGDGYIIENPTNSCDMGEPVASGPVDEWNADNITPGIGYEYVWNTDPLYGTMTEVVDNMLLPQHTYISTFGNELTDYYYPSGSYQPEGDLSDFIGTELNGTWTIIVTDFYLLDNGYIFGWNVSVSSPQSDSIITITEPPAPVITSSYIEPACGAETGSIDITVEELNPTSFLWNNGATTEDIENLPAGTYSVEITGDDGCVYNYDFDLSNNGTLVLDADIEAETCVNANDGSIDLTITGGTPDYDFSWSNGAITEDISNLAPANYTINVVDGDDCLGVETFVVPEALSISIVGSITHENCNDREGGIDLTISGGVSPYTFLWSNGETTQNINELQQGDYTVTVTDANDCSTQKTFAVVNYLGNCIPDCDIEITSNLIADETCGQNNGSIDLTIFTSFSPYTLEWSNGETTDDINGLSANTYSVSIIDAEGCELTQDFVIENQTSGLEIVNSSKTDETCGNEAGEIDITINGGALPYTFDWSNGASTEDLSNLSEGEYSVIVTDANGCSVNESFTIINETGDLHQTWYYIVNEKCGNGDGSIDILIDGGNPFWNGTYHYLWSNGATSKGIQNLSTGQYSCVITDQDGCQISTPIYNVIDEGGDISINWIDIDNEICGNSLGEIELEISGGDTPYNFNWSNGETTQDIFNLSAGTYSCEISDLNGCSVSTGNLSILNESGTLTLENLNSTDEFCNNNLGAIDLTISGGLEPYNFSWNTGASTEDLNGLNAGNYSCIITDDNGCQVSVNKTIYNDNGAIMIENVNVTDESCGESNGIIDITVVGAAAPITYLWNNGETTEDISNLTAGNYDVLVTDNNGCQANTNISVVNNSGTLELVNSIITNEQCGNEDGSINLVVNGTEIPITYNWNNGETTEDLTDLIAGVYSCEITDALGCSINAGPFTINNTSTSISVSDVVITDASCGSENGSIDITISGGVSPIDYLWSNGNTNQDLVNVVAGDYSVEITDATGCSISKNYQIQNNAGDLAISSYSTTNEICSNDAGSIDISVTGEEPFNFTWSNEETTEDISNLSAGSYYVTITDNKGCEITSSTFNIINEPGAFELSDIDIDNEFCNNSEGAISVEVQNGTEPITFNWNNGEITQNISDLSQGTYTCLIVDANGCELNVFATVNNMNGDLAISTTNVIDETCGDENGAIEIDISGSNTPITFLWNTGDETQNISNLNSGNYSCTITDSEGCYVMLNETVADISGNFDIINSTITEEFCNNGTGEIDITVENGQQPYIFSWDNGASTEDISNLSSGEYEVTITDNVGCVLQQTFEVTNIEGTLAITNAIITDENCGSEDGAIDITYTGETGNTYFNWSNGETTEDLINIHTGNYEITISDDFGCNTTETYFVDNITNGFVVSNFAIQNESCGNNDASIDLTITGGTEPYTYSWNNGLTTEDLTNINAGMYECEITDANGCIIFFSATIENETNGTTAQLEEIIDDQCGAQIGEINITPTGGQAPYTFMWNNGEISEDLENLSAGMYYVTVTDNSGCSYTSENYLVENTENDDLGFTNIYIENDFCGDGQGIIYFEPTIPGDYIYEIDGVQGYPPFFNLVAGDYVVSIIDGTCRVDATITVPSDGFFNSAIDTYQNEICGQENGYIEISAFGGGGPGGGGNSFSYLWSNGEITEDIYDLSAGTYTCEITQDNTGCVKVISQEIINEINFAVTSEKTDASCFENNGSIDITVSPTDNYNYNWSNGATTQDVFSLPVGTYTCEISDYLGCVDNISHEIVNHQNDLTVIPTITDATCGLANGSISINVTGAPNGYSILWENNETTNFIDNLAAGTYSVEVTDLQYGCSQIEAYDIINEATFEIFSFITNSSCSSCDDGYIELTVSPFNVEYTFNWSNGEETKDIYNLLPGDYTVEITDENDCYYQETITVGFGAGGENQKQYSIMIYPNPAENYLNIQYDFVKNNNANITMFDTKGQIVEIIDINNSKGLKSVDINNLASGLYFLKINFGENIETYKFIKK